MCWLNSKFTLFRNNFTCSNKRSYLYCENRLSTAPDTVVSDNTNRASSAEGGHGQTKLRLKHQTFWLLVTVRNVKELPSLILATGASRLIPKSYTKLHQVKILPCSEVNVQVSVKFSTDP